MKDIRILLATLLFAGLTAMLPAQNTRQTFRDSLGRNQGTATTDRTGRTTYRDSMGRIQGTASTDRTGRTTYRDAQGRIQGSRR